MTVNQVESRRCAKGASFFVPLPNVPRAAGWLRYLGMRFVPTGGAATVTVSAWFSTHSMFSAQAKSYAKAFNA